MRKMADILGLLKTHKKQGVDFFWYSFQTFGSMFLTTMIFFVAAKMLTPVDFGKYNYLLALVSFFVLFSNLGLGTSVSKYVAEYKVKNPDKIRLIIFSSLIICFILSLIVILFVLLFGRFFIRKHFKYIIYIIPLIFLISGVNIFDGVYRGLKRFKKLSIISITSGLAAFGSIFFLIKYLGIIGAILAQVLYYLIFFILLLKFTQEKSISFDRLIAKKIFAYALIIGISGLAYFLYTRADILILEYFGYIVEIGYYEIINKIFKLLYMPFVIFGLVIAPDITQLMANKKYYKIKYYTYNLYIIFVLGIGISILTYYLLPHVMQILLPKYFNESFLAMLNILLILLPFKISGSLLTNGFIVPSGFAKITAVLTVIGGIANIILDFLFITRYGFIGVFYVTVLVHSLGSIFTFIIYYRIISKKALLDGIKQPI